MEVSVPTVKLKKVGYAHNELALSRNDLDSRSQFLINYYLTLDSIEFTRHYAPIRYVELDAKAVSVLKNRSDYSIETSLGSVSPLHRWQDLIREMVGLHALKMPWVTDPRYISALGMGTDIRHYGYRGSCDKFLDNLPVEVWISHPTVPSTEEGQHSNSQNKQGDGLWVRFSRIKFKAKDPNVMFDRILQRINLYFIENSIPAALQFSYDAPSKTIGFCMTFGYWCIFSPSHRSQSLGNRLANLHLTPAKLVSREKLKAELKERREFKSTSYVDSFLVFLLNQISIVELKENRPYLLQTSPELAYQGHQFGFTPGMTPPDIWFQYVAGKTPVPQNVVDPRLELLQWTKLYEFIPTVYKWLELILKRVDPPNVLNITPIA